MATIKKVKKAQKGMTMKQLKMKYPDVDTTAKGDVRGSEMNSGAPKKVLKKYNDTYDAFDKKFKGGPAKNKMGGKVKKAQYGTKELPGIKPRKSEKVVNNYNNGPIIGGNKQLPKNKNEATELRKKIESENSTIQESLKSAFDNVNKNRYSKGNMKMGGTLSPSKKSVGKTIGKLNKAKSGSKMSKKK